VDDATVEIENIHRNLGLGKPLRQAILDGAQQIAGPTFVSTLTISIVFVSVLFLDGPPKYLFTPLALAVAFAMLASYLLSRTIVPTMVDYLLPAELAQDTAAGTAGLLACMRVSNADLSKWRRLCPWLQWNLQHRLAVFVIFAAIVASGLVLLPGWGETSFPWWIRDSFASMCEPLPAPGSNKPSDTSATWKMPSARSFPRTK
jgi:multidrug efflux pump subunit AcrB